MCQFCESHCVLGKVGSFGKMVINGLSKDQLKCMVLNNNFNAVRM